MFISNLFIPKTNGLEYLSVFAVAIFYMNKSLLSIEHPIDEPGGYVLFIVILNVILIPFMLGAFSKLKTTQQRESADLARVSVIGLIWLLLSMPAIEADFINIEGVNGMLYIFLKAIALVKLIQGVFWYFQFFIVRNIINERKLFRNDSIIMRVSNKLAKIYNNAYADAIPTRKGTWVSIIVTMVCLIMVNMSSIAEAYKPVLSLSISIAIISSILRLYPTMLKKY